MANKFGNKTAWFALLLLTAATVGIVFTPVWLIKPFSAQTARQVEISYFLKSWSPSVTLVLSVAGLLLAFFIFRNAKRLFRAVPVVLPLAVILFFTWFARQNHFEWMFEPLRDPAFASLAETDFVKDEEMVLAVKIGEDAVAFPVRQMAYHHIAPAVVGGTPITATY